MNTKIMLELMIVLIVFSSVVEAQQINSELPLIAVGRNNDKLEIHNAFEKLLEIDIGHDIKDIAFGDVNNDGSQEMAVLYQSSPNNLKWKLFNNDFYNVFTLSGDVNYYDIGHSKIVFGDVDGDGDDELVLARGKNQNNNYDACFIYDFSGFTVSSTIQGCSFGSYRYPYDLDLGDVNGDGKDEIGIAREGGSTNKAIIYKLENGVVNKKKGWGDNWYNDFYAETIAFGDIDNDGIDEVVVGRNPPDRWKLKVYNVLSYWELDEIFNKGESWNYDLKDVAFGNFDADENEELGVIRDAGGSFSWRVYNDDGNILLSGGSKWTSESTGRWVEFIDFNYDGVNSIVAGRAIPNDKKRMNVGIYSHFDGSVDKYIGEDWSTSAYVTALAIRKLSEPDFKSNLCEAEGHRWAFVSPNNLLAKSGDSLRSCCGDDSDETYDSSLNICCDTSTYNAYPTGSCCDNTEDLSSTNCGLPEQECSSCGATGMSCFCPEGCIAEEGTIIKPGGTCVGTVSQCSSCSSAVSTACECQSNCFNAGNIIDVGEDCGGGDFSVKFTYSYDLKGNLVKIQDPRNREVVKDYNTLGRVKEVTSIDTGTISYSYDSVGNLIQVTDANAKVQQRVYDGLNRLVEFYKI